MKIIGKLLMYFFFRRKTILRADERQGYTTISIATHSIECKIGSFGVHKFFI